jgi:hypothetical protein
MRKEIGTPVTLAISTWFTSNISFSIKRIGNCASLIQYTASRRRVSSFPFCKSVQKVREKSE